MGGRAIRNRAPLSRTFFVAIFCALLSVATPGQAAGWFRCGLLYRLVSLFHGRFRAVPAAADTTVPPRGDMPLGERPAIPQSDFYTVTELIPDPQVPGRFLYHVRRTAGRDPSKAGLEGSDEFERFVRRFPQAAARYGIRIVTIDGVPHFEYPSMEGLNARVRKLGRGITFWRDSGSADTDHVQIARALVARNDMVLSSDAPIASEDGRARSYHFHDMFVHVLGYEAIPEPFTHASRQRLQTLLQLYDHPRLRGATRFREEIGRLLREEVGALDQASNLVQRDLGKLSRVAPKPTDWEVVNLSLKLRALAGGKDSLVSALSPDENDFRLSRSQRRLVREVLDEAHIDGVRDVQGEAEKLAREYRAQLR